MNKTVYTRGIPSLVFFEFRVVDEVGTNGEIGDVHASPPICPLVPINASFHVISMFFGPDVAIKCTNNNFWGAIPYRDSPQLLHTGQKFAPHTKAASHPPIRESNQTAEKDNTCRA